MLIYDNCNSSSVIILSQSITNIQVLKTNKSVNIKLNLENEKENHTRLYNGVPDVQPEVHVGLPAGAAEPLAGVPE